METLTPNILERIELCIKTAKEHRGLPVQVSSNTVEVTITDLERSFISFCCLWKFYLTALEQEEKYELCKEIAEVVDIQEKFILEIAKAEGLMEDRTVENFNFIKEVAFKC